MRRNSGAFFILRACLWNERFLQRESGFVFTVAQSFVILSGALCREGPVQLADKYIGPSLRSG
jgi:hypothetical protein